MKRVGIVYHPLNETALSLAQELAEFLDSSGVSVWLCSAWKGDEVREQVPGNDLILTIGGDGTILRAVQAIAPQPIPITGVNLGKLGFMTELSAEEALNKLPVLLAGGGWIDERALLEAELTETDKEQELAQKFYVLNDAVVARGEIARMIFVKASVDGEPLTTYRADGVIVATANGSTGYSLAAGGPVLHPQADEFLLVPILPHLSLKYSLVLPPTAVVRLEIDIGPQAILSVDGHTSLPLPKGAAITVRHSQQRARFLRIQPKASFYSTLEKRLRG